MAIVFRDKVRRIFECEPRASKHNPLPTGGSEIVTPTAVRHNAKAAASTQDATVNAKTMVPRNPLFFQLFG
jgi:hypothetical protein